MQLQPHRSSENRSQECARCLIFGSILPTTISPFPTAISPDRPDLEWLRSNAAMLNEQQARRIKGEGRKSVALAADKYMGQRFLTVMGIITMGITFCRIPRACAKSPMAFFRSS